LDCKPSRSDRQARDPEVRKVYDSRRWRQVRLIKLQRDPICEMQLPGCLQEATQVHHKIALKDGGRPFLMENLESACAPCHTRTEKQGTAE
jgi:5-methylcytosine-specific restriction endonuclease McrA